MTRRDRLWRSMGIVMLVGGTAAELLVPGDAGSFRGILTLAFLGMALTGLLLLIQGKRVALALQIEGSKHRKLPDLIRSHRKRGDRRLP